MKKKVKEKVKEKVKKNYSSEKLNFGTAFHYPFNRPKGLLNILWIFLPIFGWFALIGYGIRIIQENSKGKFNELPLIAFGSDMKLGFFMFLKAIPFFLVYLIVAGILEGMTPWFNVVTFLFELFAIPLLSIHFANKQTVSSFFDFGILNAVFNNIGDYILVILKTIGLVLVFLVMIIVLVGFPAGAFTRSIFLSDFYRRNVN